MTDRGTTPSTSTAHLAPSFRLDRGRLGIAEQVAAALAKLSGTGEGLPAPGEIAQWMERPPEAHLGDYALPCFRFVKSLKKKPDEIASALASALASQGGTPDTRETWVESATPAGPFLNITVNQNALLSWLLPSAATGSLFRGMRESPEAAATRVMIEYSQPNTHKEFHVGHVRNVCLGSSLVNLFRHCGYPVVAANYIGDEGTHIAKCLWHIKSTGATPPATKRGEWLGDMYAAATHALDAAEGQLKAGYEQEISAILRSIESKSGPDYELWKESRQWSLDDFDSVYDWFHVKFDRVFFESEVSTESQEIVEEFLAKGAFVESDGAIGADLKPFKLGFMIVRKRDGNTLYATKDLALARRKFDEFKIDRSVYVVASEQNHHFKQVFKTLELMGFPQAKRCFHLSYGMVVLPEGKMSSRAGNTVTFKMLREQMTAALNQILDKYSGEWTAAEIGETARKLCEGAIKYGMLCSDPVKDVVFDMDNWLSFEGNTGPYLMYSYTRTRSILRKAAESGTSFDAGQLSHSDAWKSALASAGTTQSERELARWIQDFNHATHFACENYRPSTLANHLFYLCKAFNRFYTDVPVLKSTDPALRAGRLAMVAAFGETLKEGLALLGITPPDRM
ncbi:MAG: arginine--tRNA ligase [Pseudomonadota bacterium]|jgi:arginyl-tRNA synthetase